MQLISATSGPVRRPVGSIVSGTLVGATLEDALALRRRPNLPGTTDERPNWSTTLPVPLGEVFSDPLVSRVVDALHRP